MPAERPPRSSYVAWDRATGAPLAPAIVWQDRRTAARCEELRAAGHLELVRRRTGLRLADLGPMRAARREDLLALGIEDRRFGWPLEMILRASAAGWRIAELPVPYAPRTGKSKVTGTVAGTMRAVRDMSRVLAGA